VQCSKKSASAEPETTVSDRFVALINMGLSFFDQDDLSKNDIKLSQCIKMRSCWATSDQGRNQRLRLSGQPEILELMDARPTFREGRP
jgi:hypothetical protein